MKVYKKKLEDCSILNIIKAFPAKQIKLDGKVMNYALNEFLRGEKSYE